MSHTASPQEEAESLIKDISSINKGKLDSDSYKWPVIDYDHVSTVTCETILALINPTVPKFRGYDHVTPETPRKKQIARELDYVIADRKMLAARRVFRAQALDQTIQAKLASILRFLRSARRTETEEFNFPSSEEALLGNLRDLRRALDEVEDMVRENTDGDFTEPSTEWGDADATRVESKAF
ncbi:hypothetical protein B0H17DRAFT_1178854 [Mycena rosella]|nr:hypothetical protein B0H17DRAFT_1178854 [Mycena rosella]